MDVLRGTRAVWSARRIVTISSFTVGMELCRGNFNGLSIKCDIANPFKRPFGFFFQFFLQVSTFFNQRSHMHIRNQWLCFCHCSGSGSAQNVEEDMYGRPRQSSFIFCVTGGFGQSLHFYCTVVIPLLLFFFFFFCNIETQFWFILFIERKVRKNLGFLSVTTNSVKHILDWNIVRMDVL